MVLADGDLRVPRRRCKRVFAIDKLRDGPCNVAPVIVIFEDAAEVLLVLEA